MQVCEMDNLNFLNKNIIIRVSNTNKWTKISEKLT